jgi:hypothetical protein
LQLQGVVVKRKRLKGGGLEERGAGEGWDDLRKDRRAT